MWYLYIKVWILKQNILWYIQKIKVIFDKIYDCFKYENVTLLNIKLFLTKQSNTSKTFYAY